VKPFLRYQWTFFVALAVAAMLLASCADSDGGADTTIGGRDAPVRIDDGGDRGTRSPRVDSNTTAAPATTAAPGAAEYDRERPPERPSDVTFDDYGVNPRVDTREEAVSTFAVDVDTGAYTLMRAWVEEGYLPNRDAVRVEEYINYFDMEYPAPQDDTFAIYADGGPTPFFNRDTDLLRIGIKAREVPERRRQDINLTFVVDTSGSMDSDDKIGMVKDAMLVLVDQLDRFDSVAVVEYDSRARVALNPVAADDTREIEKAIRKLRAGGTTNAEAGLALGYDLADDMFDRDMVNRVVLISDGVANVGETGPEGILERIGERARNGIDLVTIGVGIDTYNDVLLEQLADQGDGWYAYVDSRDEAERLFRDNLTTSLQAVARDVKVQVEFDDDLVEEYRLLGFENRELDEDDFRNDRVDAGDINAGHSVTALYEVVLTRDAYRTDDPFATVRLRWADAETGDVTEIDGDVSSGVLASRFSRTNEHFQLAATVAAYAEVLRDSRYVDADLEDVLDEAEAIELRSDEFEEFVELVRRAVRLQR
jgi:Ca-activated chloride channel family protein